MPKHGNPVKAEDLVDLGDKVREAIRRSPGPGEGTQTALPAGDELRDYGPEFNARLHAGERMVGTGASPVGRTVSPGASGDQTGAASSGGQAGSSGSRSVTPPTRRPRPESERSPESAGSGPADELPTEEGGSATKLRRRLNTKTTVPDFPVQPSSRVSGPGDAQERGRPLTEGGLVEVEDEAELSSVFPVSDAFPAPASAEAAASPAPAGGAGAGSSAGSPAVGVSVRAMPNRLQCWPLRRASRVGVSLASLRVSSR